MAKPACDDAAFMELFETVGPRAMEKRLRVTGRAIYRRRKTIEARIGRALAAGGGATHRPFTPSFPAGRIGLDIDSGIMLVGSDGHYWPGAASTAHRAFVRFCKDLKPRIVIMNGDVLDGSTISRHPPINWEERPSLIREIEACRERLAEIEQVLPRSVQMAWTLGNHDARFESRLAAVAPDYARVHGVHLKDHFGERWRPAMSAWINNAVVVKHRWKGGVHSVHNNTVGSGMTMVTGHDHALRVSPYTDYNGTRYGVSTGALADPYGPQFAYGEDNPKNHRSGFAVFTFHKGRLLTPELVSVFGPDTVDFRGQLVRV